MSRDNRQDAFKLNLRAGEIVEVRSKEEILATLDNAGELDALPFMPEMLQYCGRQFRVFKSAHKTCDTAGRTGGRRMLNTVHLEELRCDGAAHGGCQAACLIFWKEAWLKRVPSQANAGTAPNAVISGTGASSGDVVWRNVLREAAEPGGTSEEEVYKCQATELVRATTPLHWSDPRQYFKDVVSGNITVRQLLQAIPFRLFSVLLRVGGYRALIWSYNRIQNLWGGVHYPFRNGKLKSETPSAVLNLQPGDLVRIKSHDQILETINERNRNKGLFFDCEMVKYCGGTYRVRDRVSRIVDERNGKMMHLRNECIMLENVTCGAHYSEGRLFCPRTIHSYWREVWLERVAETATSTVSPSSTKANDPVFECVKSDAR